MYPIFSTFRDSYLGFESVCGNFDIMDGSWISSIVDHMTELLVNYAEETDLEHSALRKAVNQQSSANENVEAALTTMNNLFSKLIKGKNLAPDYRKFASYHLTIHFLRVKFSLNNFKCDLHFSYMDRIDP